MESGTRRVRQRRTESGEDMRPIGITGSIGSGKSTVLEIFAELGAGVWDADVAVHALYEPGREGWRLVRERWGDAALEPDGRLDRAWIAARVFANPAERRALEAQIHPLVRRDMAETAARTGGPLVCAVPLLYESGWEQDFHAVVCVWCAPDIQHRRLRERGLTDDDIRARLAAQLPADEKLRRADAGIINSGSRELLRRQCEQLWRDFQSAAAGQ